jgi:hypothetical protein
MSIVVKVGQVPGRITEVAVLDGATVRDALSAGGITAPEGYTVTVNGAPASMHSAVHRNATVLVTRQIRGNIKIV